MEWPWNIAGAAVLMLFSAGSVFAADRESVDPGAGPVTASLSACLIAHLQHRDADCPEPQFAPANARKSELITSRLARARYFIDIQKLEKALEEADAAVAIDPNNAQAHHFIARLLMVLRNDDPERAQREAALARKLAPRDPAIRTTYAITLQGRQANVEAMQELNAIIAAHPQYLFAHEQRASLLMRFGQFGGSLTAYEAALAELNYIVERSKPDANLFTKRARAFLAAGNPKSAAADLSAALKLDPDRPDLLTARANAYMLAELDELAIKDLDSLLMMSNGAPRYVLADNDRANLLGQRARAFVRLRRFDDAADDMITALSIGGARAVLRAQVFLRRNGFPDVPVDGKNSPALRQAVGACFGLNACFQGMMRAI